MFKFWISNYAMIYDKFDAAHKHYVRISVSQDECELGQIYDKYTNLTSTINTED